MASTSHRTGLLWMLFILPVCSGASVPDTFTVSVSDGPVSVWMGSSIILPCSLSPAFTESLEVRWHRPDEFKTPVLLYQKQQIQQQPADSQYKDRVRLIGEPEKGMLSLEMDHVQLADSGVYVCYVSAKTAYKQARIHLVVKAMGTPPILSVSDGGSGQVNFTCESEGWSPQPTLTWRNRGAEIPIESYQSATDAHGLVSVTSWLVHSSSDVSEWIACSVGLSKDERKESRFLPGTVNDLQRKLEEMEQKSEGPWKEGLIVLFLVLCLIAVIVAVVLYRKGLEKSKDSEEAVSQQIPLSEPEVETLTREKRELQRKLDESEREMAALKKKITEVVHFHDNVQCSLGANPILSCQLFSEKSALDMEIRWFKGTDCICLYKKGQMKERSGYEGRVSICKEELENGKIFLELSKIQPEDAGKYVCQVIHREYNECALQIRYSPYATDKEMCIYPHSGGLEAIVENRPTMDASAQELS
ncbi:butyrophilin-like protein 2 isoform X1 [Alosa alosa]|uniref:butyrophilin-like protein 2 isoform X1 n=1 Tax=Alosa alosa TaxID=278164 RepID=UPI00201509E8|nr:butyrophilin-like protein 2 isoform X1 [Alosa alosa]